MRRGSAISRPAIEEGAALGGREDGTIVETADLAISQSLEQKMLKHGLTSFPRGCWSAGAQWSALVRIRAEQVRHGDQDDGDQGRQQAGGQSAGRSDENTGQRADDRRDDECIR
jgi:hypothetical protein